MNIKETEQLKKLRELLKDKGYLSLSETVEMNRLIKLELAQRKKSANRNTMRSYGIKPAN